MCNSFFPITASESASDRRSQREQPDSGPAVMPRASLAGCERARKHRLSQIDQLTVTDPSDGQFGTQGLVRTPGPSLDPGRVWALQVGRHCQLRGVCEEPVRGGASAAQGPTRGGPGQ